MDQFSGGGSLARLRFPRQIIVWGVRASARDAILRQNDWFVRLVFWISRYLLRFSNLVIVNSLASKTLLEQFGAPSSKVVVISNGIDISYFRPRTQSGLQFREIHNIGEDELLIGIVARVDPIKDHKTFISAAAVFHRSHPNTRFVIVGGGPPDHIEKLRTDPGAVQLAEKLIWAGEQREIASVYNAIDLNTLTSRSEGLPNSILEAMACGTLCVSTDVGDIKKVIRNDKLLFRVGDVNGLVSAWNHALAIRAEEEMSADKIAEWIAANYSKEQMAKRTVSTFLSLANKAEL